jgi:hypothetical protein
VSIFDPTCDVSGELAGANDCRDSPLLILRGANNDVSLECPSREIPTRFIFDRGAFLYRSFFNESARSESFTDAEVGLFRCESIQFKLQLF